jgi:lipid-A-disaccharide synthase
LVGRTPEIIELSRACVAVSGSVGLELLYRCKPSVVVYRVGSIDLRVARWLKTSRYISLVNLLAGEELFPEFLTDRSEAESVSRHISRWLDDENAYQKRCAQLAALRARVARPGACDRAAQFVLTTVGGKKKSSQEAA